MVRQKKLLVSATTLAVGLAICLVAYLATRWQTAGAPPWYSIVPPLLAVSLALVTNRLFFSLSAAVLAGGLLSAMDDGHGFLSGFFLGVGQACRFVVGTLYDVDGLQFELKRFNVGNLQILLFVVLLMPAISVMLTSGGLQGVANWLLRFARSVRSTRLVTMASGLVIFIDDYANTMIVGPTLRPMTDRQQISREKLAFLVDATAAPVAGIALVSTWIGYEVGLLADVAGSLGVDKSGYEIFFDALGFRFYCFGMIAFVFFNAYSGQDFGPMAAAEERARKHGKLLDDHATLITADSMSSAQPHPEARVHASAAVIPLIMLLAVFLGRLWFDGGGALVMAGDPWAIFRLSAWRDACGAVDSLPLLSQAAAVSLLLAVVLAVTVSRIPLVAIARAIRTGLRASLLPVTVLILAWSLKATCDDLETGKFLADVLASPLPPSAVETLVSVIGEFLTDLLLSIPLPIVFPGLVFIVAALTSFATGTSFGTMAILIPTAIPVAFQLDGGAYGLVTIISIGAVLDGAIFGDHCSPISDTTIMSSTASSCDHLAHVRTQIPYSLVVAGAALVLGYVPAALGLSKWLSHVGTIVLFAVFFQALGVYRRRWGDAEA